MVGVRPPVFLSENLLIRGHLPALDELETGHRPPIYLSAGGRQLVKGCHACLSAGSLELVRGRMSVCWEIVSTQQLFGDCLIVYLSKHRLSVGGLLVGVRPPVFLPGALDELETGHASCLSVCRRVVGSWSESICLSGRWLPVGQRLFVCMLADS